MSSFMQQCLFDYMYIVIEIIYGTLGEQFTFNS